MNLVDKSELGNIEETKIIEYKNGVIQGIKLVRTKASGEVRTQYIAYLKHSVYPSGILRFETCLNGGVITNVNQAINQAKIFVDWKTTKDLVN
jgi:hypothetical protein